MFTNRFIHIPIDLYDDTKVDVLGFTEELKTTQILVRVNPFDISHYREIAENGVLIENETLILLKNGESFVAAMSISEFEKLLDNFDRQD